MEHTRISAFKVLQANRNLQLRLYVRDLPESQTSERKALIPWCFMEGITYARARQIINSGRGLWMPKRWTAQREAAELDRITRSWAGLTP